MRRPTNRNQFALFTIAIFFGMFVLFYVMGNSLFNRPQPDELTTNEFVNAVVEERVLELTYVVNDAKVTGEYLREDETDPANAVKFVSRYVGSDSLNELMAAHPNIKYKISTASNYLLLQYIPTILLLGGLVFVGWMMFNRLEASNNRQMQFGRSRARKAHEERPTTKFSDVAGIDEVVEELEEVRDFLSDPERYHSFGAKIPRGVLLVGPPGTGKTLLARAVAGEAGVPFFSISGSDFVEMFVGVGASRVRDLFEQAKEAAPSIIFIDEIDAVGRQRGAGLGGGHDEREQTLNQLLVEMDGFADHQSVILIAATNRPDILDPALLRPGRFDRQITVMRPDLKGREAILKVHSKDKPLAHSVDLETLARMTPGFTGADLANLMNEAALLTARRKRKLITMTELTEAMERAIAGPERKSRIMTEKEKKTLAFHESGHALVAHLLENADPVHKISIISRGQALGYTLTLPEEDRFLSSRNEMLDDIAVFMGGRTAEELFCDDITTGASNDLERATNIARQMVTRYGMSDTLGLQIFGQAQHEVFLGRDYNSSPDYSDETAKRIDEEVSRIIKSAHEVARNLLTEREEQIRLMVDVLTVRETVDSEALEALLNNTWSEFLLEEDEINRKKAVELRKQELEDARKAAEAQLLREREEREAAAQLAAAAEQEKEELAKAAAEDGRGSGALTGRANSRGENSGENRGDVSSRWIPVGRTAEMPESQLESDADSTDADSADGAGIEDEDREVTLSDVVNGVVDFEDVVRLYLSDEDQDDLDVERSELDSYAGCLEGKPPTGMPLSTVPPTAAPPSGLPIAAPPSGSPVAPPASAPSGQPLSGISAPYDSTDKSDVEPAGTAYTSGSLTIDEIDQASEKSTNENNNSEG